MTKELSEQLKYLRLGNLLTHWEDYLKLAADKNLSHARWLTLLIEEESNANARTPATPAQARQICPKSGSSRPIPSSVSPSSTKSASWPSTTPWTISRRRLGGRVGPYQRPRLTAREALAGR